MGYEARCLARVRDSAGGTREATATVLLESDELIVRGDARVRVPRSAIFGSRVRGDTLTIEHSDGTVTLALGAALATKWEAKLHEPPKSRIEKLDVKRNAKVWLAGTVDDDFVAELRARTVNVVAGRAPAAWDVAFLPVEREADLRRIRRAAAALADDGILWVVHPKGANGVADSLILDAGKAVGLVATKVARFSSTHSAEKLVRPKADRRTARGAAPRAT